MSPIPSLLRIDNQTDSGQHKYSYVYDYVGNRTVMSVTDSGGTKMHVYSHDNYDKAGNTTYDGSSSMYAYDAENRLITATKTPSALSAACDTSLTLATGDSGTEIFCLLKPGAPRKHFYPRQAGGPTDGGPVKSGRLVVRPDGDSHLFECAIPWSGSPSSPPSSGRSSADTDFDRNLPSTGGVCTH